MAQPLPPGAYWPNQQQQHHQYHPAPPQPQHQHVQHSPYYPQQQPHPGHQYAYQQPQPQPAQAYPPQPPLPSRRHTYTQPPPQHVAPPSQPAYPYTHTQQLQHYAPQHPHVPTHSYARSHSPQPPGPLPRIPSGQSFSSIPSQARPPPVHPASPNAPFPPPQMRQRAVSPIPPYPPVRGSSPSRAGSRPLPAPNESRARPGSMPPPARGYSIPAVIRVPSSAGSASGHFLPSSSFPQPPGAYANPPAVHAQPITPPTSSSYQHHQAPTSYNSTSRPSSRTGRAPPAAPSAAFAQGVAAALSSQQRQSSASTHSPSRSHSRASSTSSSQHAASPQAPPSPSKSPSKQAGTQFTPGHTPKSSIAQFASFYFPEVPPDRAPAVPEKPASRSPSPTRASIAVPSAPNSTPRTPVPVPGMSNGSGRPLPMPKGQPNNSATTPSQPSRTQRDSSPVRPGSIFTSNDRVHSPSKGLSMAGPGKLPEPPAVPSRSLPRRSQSPVRRSGSPVKIPAVFADAAAASHTSTESTTMAMARDRSGSRAPTQTASTMSLPQTPTSSASVTASTISLPAAQDAAPLVGGKFVPMWKRNLDGPLGSHMLTRSPTTFTNSSASSSGSGVSAAPSTDLATAPSSASSSRRPLPVSPTKPPDLSQVRNPVRSSTLPADLKGQSTPVESAPKVNSAYGIRNFTRRDPSPSTSVSPPLEAHAKKMARTGPRALPGYMSSAGRASSIDTAAPKATPQLTRRSENDGLPPLPRPPIVVPVDSSSSDRTSRKPLPRHLPPDLSDAPPLPVRRSPSPIRIQPQSPTKHADGPLPSIPHGRQNQVTVSTAKQTFSPKPSRPISMAPDNPIASPAPVGGRDTIANIPKIQFPGQHNGSDSEDERAEPTVSIIGAPEINVSSLDAGPQIVIGGPPEVRISHPSMSVNPPTTLNNQRGLPPPPAKKSGLACGGCGGPIAGRIVSAMNARWHPACFKCCTCGELLEHVSSYEWEGRAYCHLDYHEKFAPKCYHCKTAIVDERFITLDDTALGKRTYHEQHFFCAECGDPFLAPSTSNPKSRGGATGNLCVNGDGEFEDDDVGFTVYKGHPYCEACHVRLRLPKCARCKRSIRDNDRAVEALGGKWCWSCFVCTRCGQPFDNPSFFERGKQPFCEDCFSIILRNDI